MLLNNLEYKVKNSINIALIVPYYYIELYYYFSFYGNVYIQTYEPYAHGPYLGSRLRFLAHNYLHSAAGFIGKKLNSPKIARLLSRILNPRHRFQSLNVAQDLRLAAPEKIDLVVVVELLCRYDLRPFRNAVKAYWAIDSFNSNRIFMYRNVVNLEEFDIVFAAHKYGVEHFRSAGFHAEFLPLALRYEWIYRPINSAKKYDVVFVGKLQGNTYSRRIRILKSIVEKLKSKDVKVFYTSAWHHDAALLYNSSKIVLNVSRLGEINLRVFEVLGTNSFLLNDNGEVKLLFNPGEHLDVFEDVDDAVEKILIYLREPKLREKIANQGYREVINKHTMYHRVEDMLKRAGFAPARRWSEFLPKLLHSSIK